MNDAFDIMWDALAEAGKCDARGGWQYERIRGEWEAHGLLFAALLFITTHANEPCEPDTEDTKEVMP